MNKYLPTIMILSLLSLGTACSGSEKRNDKTDTTEDSVVPMSELAQPADTIDSISIYFSDDLKALRIRGDVEHRSAVRNDPGMIYPEPVMELEFDESGSLLSSLKGIYAKTDSAGFNYEFSMNEGDGTSWVMTYTEFNEEGYPVKSEIEEDGPQGSAEVKLQYYGYSYDSKGNWVLRTVAMNRVFTDIETGEKTTSSHQWKEVCSYKYRE